MSPAAPHARPPGLPCSGSRLARPVVVILTLASASACLLLSAARADAYQQTMTCSEGGGIYACEPGQRPIGIRWPKRTLTYRIHERGSDSAGDAGQVSEALRQAARQSFAAWNQASCSDLNLVEGPLTSVEAIGFSCKPAPSNEGGDNLNLLVWRQQWPYASSGVYALTSVTFNPSTGIIYDADIEFNEQSFTFTLTDQPSRVQVDVRNTLTHEAGHLLGLDHSALPEATMYGMAPLGELIKRDLHPDDIDGLCAIYPRGSNPDASQAQDICQQVKEAEGGCGCRSIHAPSTPRSAAWALLLALAASGLMASRRRLPARQDARP